MRGIHDDVKRRGAEIVAVGNGSPKHAREFVESEGVPFLVLTDPSRKTYRAAGLASGLAKTFAPKSLALSLPALVRGFRQSRTKGHPFQQGGAFVFAKGGRELFAFRSRVAGEHPDPVELLAALDR